MKPPIQIVPFLHASTAVASVSTLFSLPAIPSWLENLTIRPSGNTILATRLDVPQLWSIDIPTGEGTVLANAPSSAALVGITQRLPSSSPRRQDEDEVYYIAGVNYTSTGVAPNSSVLYSLTYHHHHHKNNNHNSPSCKSSASSSSSLGSPCYITFQKALSLPQMTSSTASHPCPRQPSS